MNLKKSLETSHELVENKDEVHLAQTDVISRTPVKHLKHAKMYERLLGVGVIHSNYTIYTISSEQLE